MQIIMAAIQLIILALVSTILALAVFTLLGITISFGYVFSICLICQATLEISTRIIRSKVK